MLLAGKSAIVYGAGGAMQFGGPIAVVEGVGVTHLRYRVKK